MVVLTILDDPEPEDNESIKVSLVHTEGGSRILPSFDTVTVIILANDNVGGIISFHTASRSVIGREGESLVMTMLSLTLVSIFVPSVDNSDCSTVQRMPAGRE